MSQAKAHESVDCVVVGCNWVAYFITKILRQRQARIVCIAPDRAAPVEAFSFVSPITASPTDTDTALYEAWHSFLSSLSGTTEMVDTQWLQPNGRAWTGFGASTPEEFEIIDPWFKGAALATSDPMSIQFERLWHELGVGTLTPKDSWQVDVRDDASVDADLKTAKIHVNVDQFHFISAQQCFWCVSPRALAERVTGMQLSSRARSKLAKAPSFGRVQVSMDFSEVLPNGCYVLPPDREQPLVMAQVKGNCIDVWALAPTADLADSEVCGHLVRYLQKVPAKIQFAGQPIGEPRDKRINVSFSEVCSLSLSVGNLPGRASSGDDIPITKAAGSSRSSADLASPPALCLASPGLNQPATLDNSLRTAMLVTESAPLISQAEQIQVDPTASPC